MLNNVLSNLSQFSSVQFTSIIVLSQMGKLDLQSRLKKKKKVLVMTITEYDFCKLYSV